MNILKMIIFFAAVVASSTGAAWGACPVLNDSYGHCVVSTIPSDPELAKEWADHLPTQFFIKTVAHTPQIATYDVDLQFADNAFHDRFVADGILHSNAVPGAKNQTVRETTASCIQGALEVNYRSGLGNEFGTITSSDFTEAKVAAQPQGNQLKVTITIGRPMFEMVQMLCSAE